MTKIPYHLGVIIDGNRRWARERGLSSLEGHKKGLEVAKEIIKCCRKKGVKILTVFVFSTENWKRAKEEVSYLMKLLKKALSFVNLKEFQQAGIRVRVIGERERLSKLFQSAIDRAETMTKNNKEMILNFALSYGGRLEIVQAIKNIIKGKIPLEKISEETIKENLWVPDVDLVIRTGKEQRISNFLIWQAAYAELYFPKKYWPDFSEKDLNKALLEYARRQRRFGQ